MTQTTEKTSVLPAELCGCPIDSALGTTGSFLAIGPGGRGVVLKRMEEDCLLNGLLHPSIRERLSRVRELAHAGVANLHGVGREGKEAYLIWEYVNGSTFDEYASAEGRTPRELAVAARELILAVDSLHLQGIVHGALGSGNIIVAPGGSVRLTHVSPLLYDDLTVDIAAVGSLLEQAIERRREQGSELGQLLAEAQGHDLSLRELSARLAAFIESREVQAERPADPDEVEGPRRRNFFGAALVAVAGIALAYGLVVMAQGGSLELPRSLHLPQVIAPK